MKYKHSRRLLLLLNILIVIFAFLFMAKIRDGTRRILSDFTWWRSLFAFTLIWIISSVLGGKYMLQKVSSGFKMVKQIIQCDMFAAAVVFGVMFVFDQFRYSRTIVLGTMLGSFLLEVFLFVGIYYALRFRRENRDYTASPLVTKSEALEQAQNLTHFQQPPKDIPAINHSSYAPPYSECKPDESILIPLEQDYLKKQEELLAFIKEYLDISRFCKSQTLILDSEAYSNIESEAPNSRHLFINLHRVNDLRRVNLYLIKANELLMDGGVLICRGQTITQRRDMFYKQFTPVLGAPLYFLDFLLRRVMPKLPVLQGWYFALTKGQNRALSETEMLGRFYFCGFELIHKREINGKMHFILKKARPPRTDPSPTYGPLIRLKRLGKDGNIIYVKKLRTMHPYSEYLQDYVYQTNALQEGGKFKNDFRVTSWGRILRALWIDELPQLLNFFQGDLALVGVRALSQHYFALYPPDMQQLRLKFRPGLMPPFYADMPQTFDEIVESERIYIQQKQKKPFATDWKYLWLGVGNILFNRARSK